MKTKFVAVFAILAFALTGCKNEKPIDDLKVVTPEVVDKTFKVTLKVVVKKDDDIALFSTEDGSLNFTEEPIWLGIKGSDSEQDMVFTLPEGSFPTLFRIDFGVKKDQEDIIWKSIKFEYAGKTREIQGAQLATYFRPDDSKCSFDATTGLIKAVVKDGQRQIPSIYPLENMLPAEIEKLAK